MSTLRSSARVRLHNASIIALTINLLYSYSIEIQEIRLQVLRSDGSFLSIFFQFWLILCRFGYFVQFTDNKNRE